MEISNIKNNITTDVLDRFTTEEYIELIEKNVKENSKVSKQDFIDVLREFI